MDKTEDVKNTAQPKKKAKAKPAPPAEPAIVVKDLKIQYKCIKSFSVKKSLFRLKKSQTEVFEAIHGISFEVPKGEIMGIVGKNGSGKSTLLRAIAGIFSADSGSIETTTDSISLLSLGVGFQKKLTGRENIMLSGMLLGFSEQQVMDKMDAIIEFADLGEFIDSPVKTYSSGMYSKLAFSITVILETDILLIDEVLSVGDIKFKKKSLKKIKQLIRDKDRTVMIVSHNVGMLRKLCTSILWLHQGDLKMLGGTEEVLAAYEEFMS